MSRRIGIAIALLVAAAIAVWFFTSGDEEILPPQEEPVALEEPLTPEPPPESEESPAHLSYSVPSVPSQATAERAVSFAADVPLLPENAAADEEEPPPIRHTRLWGVVTDEGEQPVAEAVVSVLDSYYGLGTVLAATQTDFQGIFEFHDIHRLTPGRGDEIEIIVFAEAPGYAMGFGYSDLDAGESEVRIDVELSPGGLGIEGLVRWEDGEPVAFAEIFAASHHEECISRATCDARGQFHLQGLPREDFYALVRTPGGLWREAEGHMDPEEGPVELVLDPDIGVITGQVVGAVSRTPQPGAVVFLGSDVNGMRSSSQTADGEGRFRFEGLPMTGWIVHSGEGTGQGGENVHLSSEEPEQEVILSFPEIFTVVGTAVDLETDDPVPGLALALKTSPRGEETEARTDGSGRFEVPLLLAPSDPARTMVIFTLSDPPWVFERGTREIAEHIDLTAEEPPSVRLVLVRGRPLEVLVQDPEGVPLAGAELRLISEVEMPMDLGRTDASGCLVAVRSERMVECQVLGTHEDWQFLSSPLVMLRETSTVVQPSPTVDLEILVLDPDGDPAPGAHVQVTGSTGELGAVDPRGMDQHNRGSTDSETTDESGLALFEGRPRTQHILQAGLAGDPITGGPSVDGRIRILLAEAHDQIDLSRAATDPVRVTMWLQARDDATVTGQVLDPQGTPLPGAEVRWNSYQEIDGELDQYSRPTPRMNEPPDAVADAQGRFTLTGTSAQSHIGFSISCEGYLTATQPPVIRDGESLEIRLAPTITLQGRIAINSAGSAYYLFLPAQPEEGEGWVVGVIRYPREDATVASGVLRWGLPRLMQIPIEYTYPSPAWLLAITTDGRVATADFSLGLEPAQVIDLGTLNLAPAHDLEGRILSAMGEPMTDAIALWEIREARPPNGWEEHFAWTDVADSQGQFALRGLPPGPTRVLVHVDRALRQVFEVDLPTGGPIDLVLDPLEFATLTLRVLDQSGSPVVGAQTCVTLNRRGSRQSGPIHTDHTGEAIHTDLIPGPNLLYLTMVNRGISFFLNIGADLAAGDQTEVIDLSTWPVLRGRVTRGDEPAANAALSLYEHGQSNNPHRISLSADELGNFEVPLLPGTWDIQTDAGWPRAVVEIPGEEFIEIDLLD
jgi:hypothetical protein